MEEEYMKCPKCNEFVHDLAVACPYCNANIPVEGRNIPPSFVLDNPIKQNATPNSTDPSNTSNNSCIRHNDKFKDIDPQIIKPEAQTKPIQTEYIDPATYYQGYYQNAIGNLYKAQEINDVPKESLEALCALFPLMGLILYLVNQKKKPCSASKYGKVALWSLAISMIISVVSFLLTCLVAFIGIFGFSTGFAG
jgi:hypothetical protein